MQPDAVIRNWSGILAPAKYELTDAEILSRYGPLLERAVFAFMEDPAYVVKMAEAAASLQNKRRARTDKLAS